MSKRKSTKPKKNPKGKSAAKSRKSPAPTKSGTESMMMKKLRKVIDSSEEHPSEIKLKPRATVEKINEILKGSPFKDLEVGDIAFAPPGRKCVRYEPVYDNAGNLIGWKCVEWT